MDKTETKLLEDLNHHRDIMAGMESKLTHILSSHDKLHASMSNLEAVSHLDSQYIIIMDLYRNLCIDMYDFRRLWRNAWIDIDEKVIKHKKQSAKKQRKEEGQS